METGKQHSARGGLSLLLLMLGMIGCEPPQSESPDATANSVEPGALPVLTVGAGPEQDKGFLEWCQDAAAPDGSSLYGHGAAPLMWRPTTA